MITVANVTTFKITDATLYVRIVTLLAEDNTKLSKQLSEGFKRSVYWKKYKVIDNIPVQIATQNEKNSIRELLNSSWQRVKDCLSLLMIIQQVLIKFLLILMKNIFFKELTYKITTSKLMGETFMISQLLTQLSNTTKSEKY